MRRSLWVSLLAIVGLAVVALGATIAAGNTPLLGLDLQGGVSVVLQPKANVKSGTLNQAISIIRNRVDALGVAEPDITRQGNSIVVQLPGIKDPQRALDLVGQTAQLYFRSVQNGNLPPEESTPVTPTASTITGTATSTATTAKATGIPTTKDEDDKPEATVVLPLKEKAGKGKVVSRMQLGPALAKGTILSGANAEVDPSNGQWRVAFSAGGSGRKKLCDITTQLNGQPMAIVLDHVVISAPTVQQPLCDGRGVITGQFSEREAKDLGLVLRYGSLPVELKRATTETVSATLGKDSLHAGIVAGLIGLGLVALYMILYYRALGIVVILGLAVSGALMYSLVALLSETRGLALTLSGAVGIIVSVGVTVDSYVVYFERLKDEIRSGKTVRSSLDRGFKRAYRTILAADAVSFIGAMLLYVLTVGSVRGFAFFLGLSTLLDVIVAYFFTRPMVALLGRNRVFTEARWLGVARGLNARPAGSTT